MSAKSIVQEIKKRFPTTTGSCFKWKKDVTVITLDDLEFALDRLKRENKILFMGGGFHDVEEFYRDD